MLLLEDDLSLDKGHHRPRSTGAATPKVFSMPLTTQAMQSCTVAAVAMVGAAKLRGTIDMRTAERVTVFISWTPWTTTASPARRVGVEVEVDIAR